MEERNNDNSSYSNNWFYCSTKTTTTTAPEISSNNNIKNIKINGQDVRYKQDKTDYSVKLPYDMTEIDVTVELESKKSYLSSNW